MNPALRLARLDLLTLLCLSIVAAGSQHANGQTPNAPVPDVELKPGTAEAGALFGYTMAAGRVGPTFDTNDDVVVCAIMEDEPGLPPILNAGATYTFNDGPLSLHAAFPRLIPSGALSDDMDMGRLGVAIGDPRGTTASPMENLLLVGAWGRPGRYLACVPPESFPTLGSVEVFNLTSWGRPS